MFEIFCNMDCFRGTQRQVGDAEAADLVSSRLPGYQTDLGIPVAGGKTERCRQLEIGAVGTFPIFIILIVVASKVGLP